MSKIIFEKVVISNFLSFGKGPYTITLNEGLSTLIKGDNRDVGNPGDSTNGVGKTSFMQAIVWAIYGQGVESRLKSDDYINSTNEKKLLVELYFSIGNKQYVIVRGRKPNLLEFHEDGVSLTRSSMDETTKTIMSVIDIPYDVFMRTYFATPHVEPFMKMTPALQRDFMEKLLSLDVLTERADVLTKVIRKDIQADLKVVSQDIDNAKANNTKVDHNVSVINKKIDEWEDVHRQSLKTIQDKIDNFVIGTDEDIQLIEDYKESEEIIKKIEKTIEEVKYSIQTKEYPLKENRDLISQFENFLEKSNNFSKNIEKTRKELKEKLDGLPTEDDCLYSIESEKKANEYKAAIKSGTTQAENYESEIGRIEKQIKKLTSEVETLEKGKCPYCKQSHFDDEKVASLKKEIDELNEKLGSVENELNLCIKNIEKIYDDLEAEERLINVKDADKVLRERNTLVDKLANIDTKNPYEEQLSTYEDVSVYEKKIKTLESEIDGLSKKANELKEEYQGALAISKSLKEEMRFSSMEEITSSKKIHEMLLADIEKEKGNKNPYLEEMQRMAGMYVDTVELDEKFDSLSKDLEHVGYLIKLLTDPKSFIRKSILDLYVPFLNKKINQNLEDIGLSHVVEINPEMTVNITYMNKDVSYFSMSQGERLRLNVATTLAFIDLLSLLGKNCNLLMVDEYMDSAVDKSGMLDIMKKLSNGYDDVFIISHREEVTEMVDRVLTVTKKNGFSDLEW